MARGSDDCASRRRHDRSRRPRASWGDLERLFDNVKRHGSLCFCQRFKIPDRLWRSIDSDERAFRPRAQTECNQPASDTTSGLVAYLNGEAVGWCAVEPRVDYPGLRTTRVVWAGRHEDKNDRRVWAITCLIVRIGHRRHGITYPLVAAPANYAKAKGASAIRLRLRSLGPFALSRLADIA